MRSRIIAALTVLLFISGGFFPAKGNDAAPRLDTKSRIAVNRILAGGCYHCYEGNDDVVDTPAPKGYKPFYVSHYGRHGARYHTPRMVEYCNPVELIKADSLGLLTPEGKAVLAKILKLKHLHEGMAGELSIRGYREHEGIAHRLDERCPELFRRIGNRDSVRCISSNYSRCVLSMAAFAGTIKVKNPYLKISQTAGQKYFDLLTAGYQETRTMAKKVSSTCKAAYQQRFDPTRLGTVLFQSVPLGLNLMKAVIPIYYYGCIAEDLVNETGEYIDLFSVFTVDELHALWSVSSDDVYGEMCGSSEYGDLVTAGAAKIVRRMVSDADDALQDCSTVAADFRFGHDNGLLPLMSLLGIEGTVTVPYLGSYDYFPSYIDQTASNLQLIFYRNVKTGDFLVKILFNEKETSLKGLAPVSGPYYSWPSLREYLCGISSSAVSRS